MVIAFPPHVVALLRGRMLRPKLKRLVTAACSAVPMNARAWLARARPCFEQGLVLPYTPRGYCSSCPVGWNGAGGASNAARFNGSRGVPMFATPMRTHLQPRAAQRHRTIAPLI